MSTTTINQTGTHGKLTIRQYGPNQTQLHIGADVTILFSYETPVAACIRGAWFKTGKRHSNTTSKHVAAWLAGMSAQTRDQDWFDYLLSNVEAPAIDQAS